MIGGDMSHAEAVGRQKPGAGLLRFLLRMPILLYRIRLGWLLGNRFLLLKHIGRKTGLEHRTILEVLRHDRTQGCYIVSSGWGTSSQWFKNIQQQPEVKIETGGREMRATATILAEQQAEQEIRDYAQRHPAAYREISNRILGEPTTGEPEEFTRLAKTIPLLSLRPGNSDSHA
jgi:deazaflavin-dependent oxidoreductase (nitroreductase family)